MSDTELIALAALANVEAVQMAGDNACRIACGESPAWTEGCGTMRATELLREELHRRGIKL